MVVLRVTTGDRPRRSNNAAGRSRFCIKGGAQRHPGGMRSTLEAGSEPMQGRCGRCGSCGHWDCQMMWKQSKAVSTSLSVLYLSWLSVR